MRPIATDTARASWRRQSLASSPGSSSLSESTDSAARSTSTGLTFALLNLIALMGVTVLVAVFLALACTLLIRVLREKEKSPPWVATAADLASSIAVALLALIFGLSR